ncbi:MAG TPA: sigma 54-interacting transcriptional regulator [Dissulfurispiraceae bacterium]|nr:sigma 54-interacting transcriptional regulator [Dissulfurispiraceae bacterium]
MRTAVFRHTLALLRDSIHNERVSIKAIAERIRYDPGLYFATLSALNLSGRQEEVTTISQAISMIGTDLLERTILEQDHFLEREYLLLWTYAVLCGEIAAHVNDHAAIGADEEAFFAAVLPVLGMLALLEQKPLYRRVIDFLLRVPIEDRIYIERQLFGTDHIEQLRMHVVSPKLYRDLVSLMGVIFGPDGKRRERLEQTGRLSIGFKTLQLFQLRDVADAGAQSLLFPLVVEAREQFQELSKRFFKLSEKDTEELLSDVIASFESLCTEFKVDDVALAYIAEAQSYQYPVYLFATNNKAFDIELHKAFQANAAGQTVLIYGEPNVGKRLLAAALRDRPDNPRRLKAFLALHCGSMNAETLEIELFGAKGGFMGLEKQKGLFELAHGGTLFLKDIDRIPVHQQDKLAEVLKAGAFFRIGGTDAIPFDLKFMLSTRLNIVEEATAGRFSPALVEALSPFPIRIPPLRERREDIPFIAEGIIEKYQLGLYDEVMLLGLYEYFDRQEFPDNLRDLKRLLFFLGAKHLAYA